MQRITKPFLMMALSLLLAASIAFTARGEQEGADEPMESDRYAPALGVATERDPFFPSRIDTATGELVPSDEFLKPERCKTCHPQLYEQWKGSMHSNSWNDPLFQALVKYASKETNGLTDKLCLGCHTPIGVISGEFPPIDEANLSEVAATGVSCDFCHTVSKTKGVGNIPAISEPGVVKRGPFSDSKSPFHKTAFSELHTSPEFCGLCHNVSHPLTGLPIEQTYTEWLRGPYRAAGVPCQHCHMTPPNPPTAFTKNPGEACVMGPEREHWWTHQFVGGNAFVTELLGSKTHADYARNRLKAAAKVEIISPAAVHKPELFEFKVKVSNIGCGHYLPTGLTETREMWLDVSVLDADGNELYRSGDLNEHGEIEPDAVVYHTVVGDQNGEPTWKFWEATVVLFDYRIPPKGYRIEKYASYVTEDTKLPLTVRATLKYRSAPPHLLKTLMGEDAPEAPIIEMTNAELTVE